MLGITNKLGWFSKKDQPDKNSDKTVLEDPNTNKRVAQITLDTADGAEVMFSDSAGFAATSVNFDVGVGSEKSLIHKYRQAANVPEVDSAISEICDGAISMGSMDKPVRLNMDGIDEDYEMRDKLVDAFDDVLKLYKFNDHGYDYFRQWYIDGQIFFHIEVDASNPQHGILGLSLLDPLNIKKFKEVKKVRRTNKVTGEQLESLKVVTEYYVYTDKHTNNTYNIDANAIVHCTSGLSARTNEIEFPISFLHKTLKTINQLKHLEDSLVIYRIARAPERRMFYIDTGNLPPMKEERLMQSLMNRYKNKMTYDASTGEIDDESKSMSMLEDFWLPRKEGGRGTEVSTLPGGQNLGSIEDVQFFQKKLYRSLNVPQSRLDAETAYAIGTATDVSRAEVKFQKFVDRIRRKFSKILIEALRTHSILKNICSEDEWRNEIAECITIDFIEDNHFAELKSFEVMKERIAMLDSIQGHIGEYYSKTWIRRNVLNMTDEEWNIIKDELKYEDLENEEGGDAEGGEGGDDDYDWDAEGGDDTPAPEAEAPEAEAPAEEEPI